MRRFVAFSGSRYLSSSGGGAVCALSLLATFGGAGLPLATGCCPSGLDFFCAKFCKSAGLPISIFSVPGVRSPAALRSRTKQLVASASLLFVFPVSPVVSHSGSWLSVFAAASSGVPVFVFLPSCPVSALPLCRGVSGWRSVPLLGFDFWVPVVPVVQQSIF